MCVHVNKHTLTTLIMSLWWHLLKGGTYKAASKHVRGKGNGQAKFGKDQILIPR